MITKEQVLNSVIAAISTYPGITIVRSEVYVNEAMNYTVAVITTQVTDDDPDWITIKSWGCHLDPARQSRVPPKESLLIEELSMTRKQFLKLQEVKL